MTVLKLREHREKHKMSQRDIAERLDMTQQGYFKWEKGISFPNPDKILQLCKIFNCTPNDLFGIKGVHLVVADKIRKGED